MARDPAVEIVRVEAQPIAVVAFLAAQGEQSKLVMAGCGEVWNFIRASAFEGAGRNVAVYHDWVGDRLRAESGVEVTPAFAGNDRVRLSATPRGWVVHATHIGPYARLADAHRAALHRAEKERRLLDGPSWEIYGHWTEDEERLRTDVYYLLRS